MGIAQLKLFFKKGENTMALLLAILILSLLITSDFIINTFYTNYFLYVLVSCVLVIIGTTFISLKGNFLISTKVLKSIGLVALWIIYILLNDNYININGEKFKSNFLIVSLLLFVLLVLLFSNYPKLKEYVFLFLTIVAFAECIYCIYQFFNFLKTDTIIRVTGTWVNPNITAMYLALLLPYILLNVLSKTNKYRKVFLALLGLVVITLILLKCRTAILGSLLALVLTLELRFNILKNFLTKQSKLLVYLSLTIFISLIAVIAFFAYYAKQDSADGRKLIWNLSIKMIAEKPLFGYGYGNFERDYNLAQAKYFANNGGTETERWNASHTDMAYNEFLMNIFEGGIIGGIFFILFTVFILIKSKFIICENDLFINNENKYLKSYSLMQINISVVIGTVVLLSMSLVNFTITAVPLMCIFILYTSMIDGTRLKKNEVAFVSITKRYYLLFPIGVFGIFLFFSNTASAFFQKQITNAINYAKNKDNESALSILMAIPSKYQKNANFYQTIGNVYHQSNQKNNTFKIYKESVFFSSTTYLYEQLGNCYLKQKLFFKAIENFEIAMNIQPNRFTPRYYLMNIYIEQKDKLNAVKYANDILQLKEKVPSHTTKTIKKIANEFLKLLNKTNEH